MMLTVAHVVANATFLQIQKVSHPDKAIARVKAVSHDSDLALLEVIEPVDFLSDIEPAELGEMPRLRDEVAVVGYPVGGEEISITAGVVVLHVDHGGSADAILQPRDVITTIDGLSIANNGTVQYMNRYRTRYDVVLGYRYIGDKVKLDIKRDGKAKTVEVELTKWMPLVPRSRYDLPPQYFVYGGL